MKKIFFLVLLFGSLNGLTGCLDSAIAPTSDVRTTTAKSTKDNTEEFVRQQSERKPVKGSDLSFKIVQDNQPIPKEITEPRLIFPLLGLAIAVLGYSVMKRNSKQ